MFSSFAAGECVAARPAFLVAPVDVGHGAKRGVPLITASVGVAFCGLLVLLGMAGSARAEVDNDKWIAKTLKCDGFTDNRCYRFTDRRRRGKPYLQPYRHTDEPERRVYGSWNGYWRHKHRYAHLYPDRPYNGWRYHDRYGRLRDHYYGRSHERYHGRRHHLRDDDKYERRDDDKYERRHEARYERYEGRHDRRHERQCLYMITMKGTEAQTENGALISAKRAWRASVRADYGERYQDLNHAKRAEYRCWRSSTNESALGRAGEWLTGQYRKRCQIWAVPCLGERVPLDGDKDDNE